ncbi:Eco57I restriction-modification methylase domain-containing protein [bacterium]|nr:Eco57I restriction-modification methylase domain-containing protein [bacterium]
MDYNSAKTLIKDTFNYPFDEGRYRNFVINLLNDVDEGKGFPYLSGNYIKDSFKGHVSKYRRIGTYIDPKGEKVDVLIVHLKNQWSLERSRSMLRNFAADYLKNRDEKDAALIGYTTDNPDDWRFSLVRMEYKLEETESGRIKVKEELTPAKRYSFLVGKNEPNHTAQAQLVGILENDRKNPTISDIETAFSVDAVTKQFYKDYRSQFEILWNELNDIVSKDPKIAEEFETKSIDTANFAKKLMGQIVFLYFLQKKGWLGVGKDDNGNFKEWGTGPKNFLHRLFKKEFTDYGNFFNDVLEPFFYEALASERHNDIYSRFNCKIPFLNGGLFEPLNDYNWEETDILIDNDLIADVFRTFDQYNFTVREDEPLEKEVAVDPEMLGKVFENLLPENLRKGKGAYYTPRTIVHYMCQESLINYLDTECEPVPKEDIETLIREGDIVLELETAIESGTKSYKPVLMDSIKENAQLLDDALANIKVCDPAIGSGAFPVGMLNEIVKARTVLSLYLTMESINCVDGASTQTMQSKKDRTIYSFKRHCIQNSLYGVDIDPGAIEIAKLRLWLSLVVDEDDYTTIQALPNLDYKIMQGNSLIEEFHGISLDIEKKNDQENLFAGGASLDKLIDDLHQKQADFFNAEHPKEKKKKRQDVETAIYNIFHSELEKKKNISPREAQEIETDLREMTHGNKERNFFPWKLYFADVFREKGGFDVVIANPPYVSVEKFARTEQQAEFKRRFKTYASRGDIYCFFYERGLYLLRDIGVLTFISSNKFQRAGYGKGLRQVLTTQRIESLMDFCELPVFAAATDPMIVIVTKAVPSTDHDFPVVVIKDESEFGSLPQSLTARGTRYKTEQLKADGWSLEGSDGLALVEKLRSKGIPLGEYVNGRFYYGIKTGLNEAFVIDRDRRDQLIREDRRSAELIKPWIRGKDIKRWTHEFHNFYVIIVRYGFHTELKKYPSILRQLSQFEKKLKARGQCKTSRNGASTGQHHWLELDNNPSESYIAAFDEPKIVFNETSKRLHAYVDSEGNAINKTGFIILTPDAQFVLSVLNSTPMDWFYRSTFPSWGDPWNSGRVQFRGYLMNRVPIPLASAAEKSRLTKLAERAARLSEAGDADGLQKTEREIDQMVYTLYGLTEEEIEIVESSIKN